MSLTIEQTDAAIRETFSNMEEGVEYVLNDYWFMQANRLLEQHDSLIFENKKEFAFSRKKHQLFLEGFVFDLDGKTDLILNSTPLALAFGTVIDTAVAFTFVLALQHNGIEKLKADTCDGKVVEIDGKKYKLTAV